MSFNDWSLYINNYEYSPRIDVSITILNNNSDGGFIQNNRILRQNVMGRKVAPNIAPSRTALDLYPSLGAKRVAFNSTPRRLTRVCTNGTLALIGLQRH